jgi:hypothetical protein
LIVRRFIDVDACDERGHDEENEFVGLAFADEEG